MTSSDGSYALSSSVDLPNLIKAGSRPNLTKLEDFLAGASKSSSYARRRVTRSSVLRVRGWERPKRRKLLPRMAGLSKASRRSAAEGSAGYDRPNLLKEICYTIAAPRGFTHISLDMGEISR